MASTPWVVMDSKAGEAVCKHCGERRRPPLPMAIRAFVRWSEAFRGLHVGCLPGKLDPVDPRDAAAKAP